MVSSQEQIRILRGRSAIFAIQCRVVPPLVLWRILIANGSSWRHKQSVARPLWATRLYVKRPEINSEDECGR